MKKVLIITPNWPPVSCPDMHRARMALPFFNDFGWEPLILKIDPYEQEGIKDLQLAGTIPNWTKVWQSGCISRRWTGWFGLYNVGIRSIFHLASLGDKIIEAEKPDVVFFSTTMFPVFVLGRYWHSGHKIPYVLDFQDPWFSGYRSRYANAPGGSLKYGLSQLIAKKMEPFALRRCCHVVSVSPQYPAMLMNRYDWLREDQFSVLPFGASENDFRQLTAAAHTQNIFNPHDGNKHWVYVGRGGGDMAFSLRCFFYAISEDRKLFPKKYDSLKLHFVGTDYAPDDRARKTVEPLAVEFGLSAIVHECTGRIPYFEALQCLSDADALIVPGSDDPGYTASKIYPYILAEKPLLAIFHEKSSVVDILKETNAGIAITFNEKKNIGETSGKISERWLRLPNLTKPETDWDAFNKYSAREMTRKLCAIFDRCLMSD